VVDDLEDVPLGPVHRGEVLEEVDLDARLRLQEPADLDEPLPLHHREGVGLGLGERSDVVAEDRLQPLMDSIGRHLVP